MERSKSNQKELYIHPTPFCQGFQVSKNWHACLYVCTIVSDRENKHKDLIHKFFYLFSLKNLCKNCAGFIDFCIAFLLKAQSSSKQNFFHTPFLQFIVS